MDGLIWGHCGATGSSRVGSPLCTTSQAPAGRTRQKGIKSRTRTLVHCIFLSHSSVLAQLTQPKEGRVTGAQCHRPCKFPRSGLEATVGWPLCGCPACVPGAGALPSVLRGLGVVAPAGYGALASRAPARHTLQPLKPGSSSLLEGVTTGAVLTLPWTL